MEDNIKEIKKYYYNKGLEDAIKNVKCGYIRAIGSDDINVIIDKKSILKLKIK